LEASPATTGGCPPSRGTVALLSKRSSLINTRHSLLDEQQEALEGQLIKVTEINLPALSREAASLTGKKGSIARIDETK
jgi:hypothetical protein